MRPVRDMRGAARPALIVGAAILAALLAGAAVALPGGASEQRRFTAEVWADNWFSLAVNGRPVGEDPVGIGTERSFNTTRLTFEAEYPLRLAVVAKDFKQDDTGLEYIGTSAQQVGDGGFVLQVTDEKTGKVVARTSDAWRSLVVHRAPLDDRCERSSDPDADCRHRVVVEPPGWTAPGFDDRRWSRADGYTPRQVRTTGGYDEVDWSAALIWSSDLRLDNTVLLRSPSFAPGDAEAE